MEKGRTHGLVKRGQLIRFIDLLSVLNFSMDTYSSQNRSVANVIFFSLGIRPTQDLFSLLKGPTRFESEAAQEAFIEKSSRPRRAFVILLGHGAEEKALQLNGSGMGDWNALVKVAPEEEEEEYLMVSRYKESLFDALLNDKKFRVGIMVKGYDTSLPADEVESFLRTHFSSCGEITHVYISTPNNRANIYFSEEEGEALVLGLHGSEVRGFRITTRSLAKVRS
ncbi:hypothetical protein YC2023_047380 [Brassica napus]